MAYAKPFPYYGDITGGVSGAEDNWDTYADLLLPVSGTSESFIFIAPRASMTGKSIFESTAHEFNIGAGYRKYVQDIMEDGAVLGANIYYDSRNTSLNNHFQQAGLGVEFLSKRVDFRANAYIPFGNNDYYLGKLYNVFENNNIASTYYYEVAMRGFDGEIGFNFPLPEQIGEFRLFGGYYHFVSDKVGKIYNGLKARAEYRPVSIVALNASVFQYENLTGAHWQAGVSFNFPFNFIKMIQGKNPLNGLFKLIKVRQKPVKDRIGEMVQRDMYVRAYMENKKRFDDLVSDEDGFPYHFTVVSPDGTGKGTFKNPASLESGAATNKNVTGNNAVLLLLGGEYNLDSTVDLSGHNARNVLITGPQEMTVRGVELGALSKGNPIIKAASGITAFKADSAGTESFSVATIEFEGSGNTGSGLEVINNTDFYLGNNSFTGFLTGVKIESSTGTVYAYNNIISGNITGAQLKGKNISFEQNIIEENINEGFFVDSGENVDIRLNLIQKNGYGINIENSSDSLIYNNELNENNFSAVNIKNSDAVEVNDNRVKHNKQSGISVSGGTGNEISENDISENTENGISISNSSGTQVENNNISENVLDGIFASGNKNLAVIENDISSNTYNGIKVINDEGVYVYKNLISSNSKSGIYIGSSEKIKISSNTSLYNKESGIHALNISSGGVYENVFYENSLHGMFVEGSSDFAIESSTFAKNALDGIYLKDISGTSVYNNIFEENLSAGIRIDSATFVTVYDNISYKNSQDGISIKNLSVSSVNYNLFQENLGLGGYFENVEDIYVQYNNFVIGSSDGAVFKNMRNGFLSGNVAEDNMANGMTFYNVYDSIVTDSIVDKNSEHAFSVLDSVNVLFDGNSIYENVKTGINIEGGSDISVNSNTIQDNAEGVNAVNVSSFTVYDNFVKNNTDVGIYISSVTNGGISRNRVIENGGLGGIYAKDLAGSVEISSNVVSSNTHTGITVINADSASLVYNEAYNNAGLGGIYTEKIDNGQIINNSANYNLSAGITVKNSSDVNLYLNALYYNDTGHGLNLTNVSGVSLNTNFFWLIEDNATDKNGLDLRDSVTFDEPSSGNNSFINSASYGGDSGPVFNYKTNIEEKDNY